MSWPLETEGALAFAAGHDEILVLEEKRANVETQLKDALFHCHADQRPRVNGKTDEHGAPLLPEISEFNPRLVARVLLARMTAIGIEAPRARNHMATLEMEAQPAPREVIPIRKPYFCSGCPHNSSMRSPEGSVSGGGIGCHVMALSQPELKTSTFSQMGGEGAQWIGAAPFSQTPHIFQNLGDGTYQHSGLLAVRAAVAAGTRITYKILFNDAVATTDGQRAEGTQDPLRITRQLREEGVTRIALVSDDPSRWQGHTDLAEGVEVFHRDALDSVQRQFREIPAVTAIVYEQTCAAESAARCPTPTDVCISTRQSAKAAVTVPSSPTVSPSSQLKRPSAASVPSTRAPAIRIFPAPKGFVRVLSNSKVRVCANPMRRLSRLGRARCWHSCRSRLFRH
ncbi:thiamine pyrophosphate-dependent enzyme [Burkholderia cenocepacia]|uniref:thiamine pyrophosphate-dependent enzyme n=1 Tax=Burkholderia cenocepacia TaxID=95486 RepID=UPI00286F2A3A|nr:thiamine pyrophosphate-dependent enzyme [Burkholderia cenocepacia]